MGMPQLLISASACVLLGWLRSTRVSVRVPEVAQGPAYQEEVLRSWGLTLIKYGTAANAASRNRATIQLNLFRPI